MKIIFLELAQGELDQAISYYNYQHQGLGDEFLGEVLKTIDLIQKYPNAWQKLSDRTRRCLIKGFPYGIVYATSGDDLVILAIAHLHRKPGYWSDRAT